MQSKTRYNEQATTKLCSPAQPRNFPPVALNCLATGQVPKVASLVLPDVNLTRPQSALHAVNSGQNQPMYIEWNCRLLQYMLANPVPPRYHLCSAPTPVWVNCHTTVSENLPRTQ